MLQQITGAPDAPWQPEVVALERTIKRHAFVRMYLEQMLLEVPEHRRHFTTVDMFLRAVNFVVHSAPIYKDVNSISWQFPLSALMNFWMMTPSGKAVLRMPLKELTPQLDAAQFAQVHRSVVVNLNSIAHVTRCENETAEIHLKGRSDVLRPRSIPTR